MDRTGLRNLTALVAGGYFRQMGSAPRPHDLRASDADRERVVALLAEAAADGRLTLDEHAERVHRAYAARTLGELARLTEDLVAARDQPLRLDDPPAVTAFFTTARREGRWVVPGRLLVTAVGGQVILDVRDAIMQSRHTIVQATLVAGQLHLLVPDGLGVVVAAARAPGPGGPAPSAAGTPRIEVRAFTAGGRVNIHTPRRPGGRWRGRFGRPSR